MKQVLIGSTVRQDQRTLKYFLDSLRDLRKDGCQADYFFVDDNDEAGSSQLLRAFRPLAARVSCLPGSHQIVPYVKDNITHRWNEQLVWRVAHNKNLIMQACLTGGYDYLLLVDSDLLLHPETLLHLIANNKDIISEIFWTRFQADSTELPNVWLRDDYKLYPAQREEQVSPEEARRRIREFLVMLRQPGTYRVGGLGACTLFSRRSLQAGVSYAEIYNLSLAGEDRHLCVRAAALGFELWADTCFPCYHIYRPRDLLGVYPFLQSQPQVRHRHYKAWIGGPLHSALESCLSFDFRRVNPVNNYRFIFTSQGWSALDKIYAAQGWQIHKSIQKAELSSIQIEDFTDDFSRLNLQAEIRGSRRGGRFQEASSLKIDCRYDGNWKIDTLRYEEPCPSQRKPSYKNQVYSGLTRRVKASPSKLTLGMLVHNEADRFLPRVLRHAACYIDEAVILNDASSDNTVTVCRNCLRDLPLFVHSNREPGFYNELQLRQQLWELLLEQEPDWLLILDADELFEERAVLAISQLIRQPDVDVYGFRTFDFWDSNHYREDSLWQAHLHYKPYLLRYQPGFTYQWLETPLHCGRFPVNINELPTGLSDLRLIHLGWSRAEDRRSKYQRYIKLDGDGKYGDIRQYHSILDPRPRLVQWEE
ncbi:glycosyltransferase [Syntrophomonas curvata]